MSKIFVLITIVGIVCLILFGLTKQISDSLQAGKRLDQSISQLNQLQQENLKLKNQYSLVSRNEYVEEVARNSLDLSKPNETMLIISPEAIKQEIASNNPLPSKPKTPNWKGWLRLFSINI